MSIPMQNASTDDIETVLDIYSADPGHAEINDRRGDIARLFQGHGSLGDLMAAGGDSADWQDLSHVVNRVMGLPGRSGLGSLARGDMEELDYFASGSHRDTPRSSFVASPGSRRTCSDSPSQPASSFPTAQ